MTELVQDKPRAPRPRPGLLIAVALEIGMVSTFAAEHSVTGLLLAAAYCWFSATWALFMGPPP